jgi:hypothetical protein
MKSHRKIYEEFHGVKIPKFMDIHHIDGNHSNNDPLNLKLVTVREHYDIHLSQCDYGAAYMVSLRLILTDEERSNIASLAAIKANSEGKCGFSLGHASAAGKKGGLRGGMHAKENRTGIFSLSPEKNKERHLNSVISRLIKNGKMCAYPRKEL